MLRRPFTICAVLVTFAVLFVHQQSVFAQTPQVNSLSPSHGYAGDQITIAGANFGSVQGQNGHVWIGNQYATVVSWSDTQIVATVASIAIGGPAKVAQNGVWSNSINFTFDPPTLSSINPTHGFAGDQMTLTGSHFGSVAGPNGNVWIGNQYATVVSWSDTQIVATASSTAIAGPAKVAQSGVWSNSINFTFDPPTLSSISPTHGFAGDQMTLTGSHFGPVAGVNGYVWIGNKYATVVSWSDTQIVATIPSDAIAGPAKMLQSGVASNSINFTFDPPTITGVVPTSAAPGAQVTVAGLKFGSTQGVNGIVQIGTVHATVVSWNDTQIVATVPSTASGTLKVAQSGVLSNGVPFTVLPVPTIASLSPSVGSSGTAVTITGTNLGSSGTVKFNGVVASTSSWSSTSITAPVPNGATTGNVVVTASGVNTSGLPFTVPTPALSQLSPTAGSSGTLITLSGSNFGSTQGSSQALINGSALSVVSWSNSTITANIPNGVTTGQALPVTVMTSAGTSNAINFTPVAPPVIAGISPASGAANTQITVSGTDFGSAQNGSAISIGGVSAIVLNWTATSIVASVPSDVGPGPASVTVNLQNVSSNSYPFTVVPALSNTSSNSGGSGTLIALSGTNFGAVQGSGSVQFGGATATISNWSNTQLLVRVPTLPVGPANITVTASGTTTNALQFSVVPTITTISPGAAVVGSDATITGGSFGNSGTVTFNSVPASVTSWTDSTIVAQVPAGADLGPVVVSSGGYASDGVPFQLTSAPAPITSLTITPQTFSMYVSETRDLVVVDNNGNPVTGATWSIADTNVASFAQDSATLTANNSGQTTITVNYQGLSAQTTVNVYIGVQFPAGTVMWSLPEVTGCFSPYTVQATPTATGITDMFSICASPSTAVPGFTDLTIAGLTVDGKQLWTTQIIGVNQSSPIVPDRFGGLLIPIVRIKLFSCTYAYICQIFVSSLERIDGDTGHVSWIHNSLATSTVGPPFLPFAIHPDGTIYTVKSDEQYGGGSENRLLAIDGMTGQPKFSVAIPQSLDSDGRTSAAYAISPSIMPDGSVFLEVSTFNSINPALYLIQVQSDGSSTSQTICPSPCIAGALPGEVIPDGHGGFLAPWTTSHDLSYTYNRVNITHNGSTFPIPALDSNSNIYGASMILGDSDTAFATDGSKVVAFDINSGSQKWTWQAPQYDLVTLVAATDGGGLVAKYLDFSSGESVVRFDSSGSVTNDSWTGSAAANIGAPAVGNLAYVASDAFVASSSSQGITYGGTHMVASGKTVKWPVPSPAASPAPDHSAKSFHIDLVSYQVVGTTTSVDISTQVQNGMMVWQQKIPGLLFQWNFQTSPVPVCAASESVCAVEPKALIDNYDSPSTCVPTTGWNFLTARLPNALQLVNGVRNTGIQILFTNGIYLDPSPQFGAGTVLEDVPFYDSGVCDTERQRNDLWIKLAAGNLVVMSNQTSHNVLAHSFGHVFGLKDQPGILAAGPPDGDGSNLMCSGSGVYCPTPLQQGTYLNYIQELSAKKYLMRWATQ